MKNILIKLPNGEKFKLELSFVAEARATYYEKNKDSEEWKEEFDFIMNDDYEGIDELFFESELFIVEMDGDSTEKEALKNLVMETPTELQKLQWANKALKDALQYLVDTKKHKDTIGKDSIYMQRKRLGWMKAKSLLSDSE